MREYQELYSMHNSHNADPPRSVARRPSAGAQHAGRGGAGNVFKESELKKEAKMSDEKAIDDTESSTSGESAEKEKSKKNWLFGKKA